MTGVGLDESQLDAPLFASEASAGDLGHSKRQVKADEGAAGIDLPGQGGEGVPAAGLRLLDARAWAVERSTGATLAAHEPNWGFTAVPGRGRWWLRGSPYSTSVRLPLRVWLHDARPGVMAQTGSAAPAAGAAVALKTATAQGARHGALASAGRPSIHGPSTGVLLPDATRPMFAT